ncbi:MAG TPA: hypothetical protein VIR65_00560 [Rhizorhapis sp.]
MARKAKANPGDGLVAPGETGKLEVEKRTDEKIGRTLARITMDPQTRNANLAMSFGSQMFGDQLKPDIAESSAVLAEEIQRAMKGDLSLASRIFTSQAISLDALFTDMARRSGNNMGHYPDAADRYMRLALKAQAACRSTLEALARLHQPREQTVKHVHVNEGGQAVVADHFHQHTGDRENGKSVKQSDATGAAGTIAALPSPDPLGNGVPIPSREGEAAMQDARRDQSRSA